jgi:hypothetical protein
MSAPCPLTPNKALQALGLPARAYNALRACLPDITVEELRGMSEERLMCIPGMGQRSARAVVEAVTPPPADEAEQIDRWVAGHRTLLLALARGEALVLPLSSFILSQSAQQ